MVCIDTFVIEIFASLKSAVMANQHNHAQRICGVRHARKLLLSSFATFSSVGWLSWRLESHTGRSGEYLSEHLMACTGSFIVRRACDVSVG